MKLIKLLAISAAIGLSTAANASNEMAYASNKVGGSIFFTYSKCVYLSTGAIIPNHFYVYSTDAYGNKVTDGCYEYKYPFYMVNWNHGASITVPISQVTLLK